jgi:hypothetical protein
MMCRLSVKLACFATTDFQLSIPITPKSFLTLFTISPSDSTARLAASCFWMKCCLVRSSSTMCQSAFMLLAGFMWWSFNERWNDDETRSRSCFGCAMLCPTLPKASRPKVCCNVKNISVPENLTFENKQHYVTYGIDRTRLRMELAR